MRQTTYVNSYDGLAVIIVLKKVSDKLAFFLCLIFRFQIQNNFRYQDPLALNQFKIFSVFLFIKQSLAKWYILILIKY